MADILPISAEQADLRRAVRQIAAKYGHRYFVECATSHKEPTGKAAHLFFDDVRVPAGALVGEAGQGFRAVFAGLNPERVTAATRWSGRPSTPGTGRLRTAPTSREMVLNFVAQHSLRLPESY